MHAAALGRPVLQRRPDRRATQIGRHNPKQGGTDSMVTLSRHLSSQDVAHQHIDLARACLSIIAAALIVLCMAAVAEAARAAKFDEKVKAPAAPSNAELASVIRDYFGTYARVNAQSMTGIVRDRDAYQQWFETQWRVQRAIDTRQPLGDLAEFGLTPNSDGSYSVDLAQYPQWDPLPARLQGLREPQALDFYAEPLKARGFRDEDIDALRAYLAKSPPRRASVQELDVAEGFVAKVQAQISARRKTDGSLLLAYMYQTGRIRYEQERFWAAGLLDSLDRQRQRILELYLREQGGRMTITPDDIDAETQFAVGSIASGEFARQLKAQRMEVQQ
jgi:hypothetical protein